MKRTHNLNSDSEYRAEAEFSARKSSTVLEAQLPDVRAPRTQLYLNRKGRRGSGVQNTVNLVYKMGFTAWFPVQAELSELWATPKWHGSINLLSLRLVVRCCPSWNPEIFFSKAPGIFSMDLVLASAAFYQNSRRTRLQQFRYGRMGFGQGSAATLNHVRLKYPDAYERSTDPEHGMSTSLEIAEGDFTTLEHSAVRLVQCSDRISQKEKLQPFAYIIVVVRTISI